VRLNKLIMSNIGPYVGLAILDFSSLGEVFLVCGKTGSGKTTIFDAVAYALYGLASGARDVSSHFAGAADDVFVELDFSVGKSRWKVQRKPARQAIKKRGLGTTDRPSEVALWQREGAAWVPSGDRIGDVDTVIARIIGLSADEFTKIVLLPQGEFQRFLEMKTGERTEILEKLFPVAIHAAVSDLARLKARDADLMARDLDGRVRAIESGVGDNPEARLQAAGDKLASVRLAEKAANAKLDAAKAADQAAGIGARVFAELDAALADMDGLLSSANEAASANARLTRAEAAVGASAAVEAARQARAEMLESERALVEAASAVAASDAKAAFITEQETRLAALQEELAEMDHDSGLLSARLAAWERFSSATARLAEARERETEAAEARKQAGKELSSHIEALTLLEAQAVDAKALEADRAAAITALSGARDAVRLAEEAAKLASELALMREKLAALERASVAAQSRRVVALAELEAAENALELARDATAASRLSARLVPGEPCPVCGSTEHGSHGLAGQELSIKFNAAEERLRLARQEISEAEKEASSAKTRYEESGNALAERTRLWSSFENAPGLVDATQALQTAKERQQVLDQTIAMEAGRVERVTQLRKVIDSLRGNLESAVSREALEGGAVSAAEAAVLESGSGSGGADPAPLVAELEQKRSAAMLQKSNLESAINAWHMERNAALARSVEAAARKNRAVISAAQARGIAEKALADAGFDDEEQWAAASLPPDQLAQIRTAVHARTTAEAGAEARLSAAKRAADGVNRPDMPAIAAALAAAVSDSSAARLSADDAAKEERELAAAVATLAGLRAERAALRSRGDRLVAMAKLLNGDTEGRRLSFKNFALGSYFTMVVEQASVRLREMSDGRYDMRVAEAKAAGRGRIGLDLEVLDAFTGLARPASSLSGGEKFLASISLALGLSDVIVARSGGLALDSIFIDEGFGSLDEETLDRAMVALDRVRGDRVIGIVSHVAELRSRVPVLVEVIKTNTGSTIRVSS